MTARSVATALVILREVRIPVRLYTSVRSSKSSELRFAQLHEKDWGRIQQKMICTRCNELVDQDKLVRGYERAKDDFVAFTQEDLRRVDAVTPNTVTVRELVDAASIDTTTIEKSYYLSPEGDGERPFSVLREMLGESLAAVGLHAANRRETLACIVARHDALILHQLRFAHEAVAPSEVPLPASVEHSGEERVLAAALAAKLRKQRFEPSEYRDGAQERVMSQIARKLDGKPLLEMPAPSPAMPLVDALRQSVA